MPAPGGTLSTSSLWGKYKLKVREPKKRRIVAQITTPLVVGIASLLGSGVGDLVASCCPCSLCARQALENRLGINKPRVVPCLGLNSEYKKAVRKFKFKCAARGGDIWYRDSVEVCEYLVEGFTGKKKEKYLEAIEMFIKGRHNYPNEFKTGGRKQAEQWPVIHACFFVKNEAVNPFKLLEDKGELVRARIIAPQYLMYYDGKRVDYSPYPILLEGRLTGNTAHGRKWIYNKRIDGGPKVPVFTCGMRNCEVAMAMLALDQNIDDTWRVVKLDCSSFDASQYIIAGIFREVDLEMASNLPVPGWMIDDLRSIYDAQDHIHFSTDDGLFGEIKGPLLSGTYNTGPNNQAKYYTVFDFAYSLVGCDKVSPFVCICAGDDTNVALQQVLFGEIDAAAKSVFLAKLRRMGVFTGPILCLKEPYGVFISTQSASGGEPVQSALLTKTWMDCVFSVTRMLGLVQVCEGEFDSFENSIFCRMRVIRTPGSVRGEATMAKDPVAVWERVRTCFKGKPDKRTCEHMVQVCIGYSVIYGDVPVLGVMSREIGKCWWELYRHFGGKDVITGTTESYMAMNEGTANFTTDIFETDNEVSDISRFCFSNQFGLSISQQLGVEDLLRELHSSGQFVRAVLDGAVGTLDFVK